MIVRLLGYGFLTLVIGYHCLLPLVSNKATIENYSKLAPTIRQRRNCDDTCYPIWKGREVAEKCKGEVVDCQGFILGTFRKGKKCECPKRSPKASPTSSRTPTVSPKPSVSFQPNQSCKGFVFENCQSASRRELLESVCKAGVETCRRVVNGVASQGVKCVCPDAPPSVSPSPSAACPGPLFNLCFTYDNFGALKKNCPNGVSGCPRFVNGQRKFGVRCRCVVKPTPTPTSTPSSSITPTSAPSKTPPPGCRTNAFTMCFPPNRLPALEEICPDGVVDCERLEAGTLRPGFQCKCKTKPSPDPATPKVMKCPVKIEETTNVRKNVYYVNVKKSKACFNIVYSYFNKAYTLTIMYEGKTLRRLFVNSRVFAPLKLCIYGKSTTIKIVYNIVPKKKIYFEASCAYKSLSGF